MLDKNEMKNASKVLRVYCSLKGIVGNSDAIEFGEQVLYGGEYDLEYMTDKRAKFIANQLRKEYAAANS